MVELVVDNRERAKHLSIKKYVKSTKGKWTIDSYSIEELKVGDYATRDVFVGVERKKYDFLWDYYSGKLVQQLTELKQAYQRPFLLIEFESIDEMQKHFNVNIETLIGMLASIPAKHGVPYHLTGYYFVPMLFRTIHKAYESLKTEKQSTTFRPVGQIRKRATVKEYKLHRLGTLPKVGPELALRIYKHFNYSYKDFINSDISELKQIPGISDGIAKMIKKVIS